MSNELRFPSGGRDGRDEELARLLQPLYAAPDDEGYWDDLHARVMRRVGSGAEGAEWWVVLSRWSRAGAAAAAVAAALAGTMWMQHRAAEARLAYEAVLAEPPVYSMELSPEGRVPGPALRVPDAGVP
jgi:hypothetical protein